MPIYRDKVKGISYSEAIAEAYASAPEDDIILDTLEFRHPTFLDSELNPFGIRVVNDHEDLLATLEDDAPLNGAEEVTFKAIYFTFTRPSETESGETPEIEISVDNVARYLIPYLDNAKESRVPIEVTWRPYLAQDLSGPHMNPPLTLTLRSITCDMSTVTARAGFGNLTNLRFPALEYTSIKFPGLAAR